MRNLTRPLWWLLVQFDPDFDHLDYGLLVLPSYSDLIFWTRMGRCNLSTAPVTVTAARQADSCGLPTDQNGQSLATLEDYANVSSG